MYNTTMPQLARFAADYVLHATVMDRTNLPGAFDYRQAEPPSDADVDYRDTNDAFLRFLPEIGLKLERTKGPVETLVIDHAERPSSN